MTEPNKEYLSDERVPTITIEGKRWPMPPLAPEQLEIVAPILLVDLPKWRSDLAAGKPITGEYFRMLGTILYWGLRRAHPDLTREEFDRMGADFATLVSAVDVVTSQTGLTRVRAAGEPAAAGETKGNFQTGAR